MKIVITSVLVDDQAKALDFYTRVLGFVKKQDVPAGEFRWLTVVSPEDPGGVELLLEPSEKPMVKEFKKFLFENNIPWTAFAVTDIQQEWQRMKALGVNFIMDPTGMGPITAAVFDDTCGNLIQIFQPNEGA